MLYTCHSAYGVQKLVLFLSFGFQGYNSDHWTWEINAFNTESSSCPPHNLCFKKEKKLALLRNPHSCAFIFILFLVSFLNFIFKSMVNLTYPNFVSKKKENMTREDGTQNDKKYLFHQPGVMFHSDFWIC